MHQALDSDRSASAEAINSVIDNFVSYINYLKVDNILPFMKVLFTILNACSFIRVCMGRTDLEEKNLGKLFRTHFVCTWKGCTEVRDRHDIEAMTDDVQDTQFHRVEIITTRNEREAINTDSMKYRRSNAGER